jgi:phage gpG-like protein
MRITVDLQGADKLVSQIERAAGALDGVIGDVVMETAADLEADVKLRHQQGPHSGKLYQRGGVVHQASGPGESPAPDTGTLMGSIFHEQDGPRAAIVGSRLAYALYLEYGTTKMRPRPMWTPAAEQIRPVFLKRMAAAVDGALS